MPYPCQLGAGQHELRVLQGRLGGSRPVREGQGRGHLTALLHLRLQVGKKKAQQNGG